MKRFLAPILGALVAIGALSIAPAQAAEPDGSRTKAVVIFGDGTSEPEGDAGEATRVALVVAGGFPTYSQYRNGATPAGEVSVQPPVDPAWFDAEKEIEFTTPDGGDASYGQILLRFDNGWEKSSTAPNNNRYVTMNQVSGREDFISSSGGSLAVYTTRCNGAVWVKTGPPNVLGGYVCEGQGVIQEEETQIVASTSPSPGGNGGLSGSGSGSSAPTLSLTLDPTETDATCSVAGVSGVRGSWVTLEAASDCTPPPSTPDATLLGWATDPDFPVDIAQRQVDNGWGTYETYNDDGQLTSVFIPAGGAAQLTNSNTLYAIWSDTSTGS